MSIRKQPFCSFVIIFAFASISAFSQDTYFTDIAPDAGMQGVVDLVQYGVAWGDFDGDGDEDCFVATHPGNQLFRNDGGSFVDVAAMAGVDDDSFGAAGGAWGDFDGDGDLDLFVCNLDAEEEGAVLVPNRLFQNNGDGNFADVAETAGVAGIVQNVTGGSTSASWIDYNGDGFIDLMVCNRFFGPLLYKNNGDETFSFASHEAGMIHEHDGDEEEGEEEAHHEETHHEETFSVEHAAWGDFDGDGDADVYFSAAVSAEHSHEDEEEHEEEHEGEESLTSNILFKNNGDGTFSDATEEAGLLNSDLSVSHSAVWGDYDNDGDLDLFVCNRGSVYEGTAADSQLFQNNGDGTFEDVSESAGIVGDVYAFNAEWVDVNNDGFLDLSIVYHPSHEDFPEGVLYQEPHPLYLSNGDGTFTNVNAEVDDALLITGLVDISHLIGVAWSDMDGDGDADAVYTENHGDGPIRLYENLTLASGAHWMEIALQDESPNTHGVGGVVSVQAGDATFIRTVSAGSAGWGASQPLLLHFGLGGDSAASVSVRWPDGALEDFGAFDADQKVTLIRGRGVSTDVGDWRLF